jgi:hypothetical protein
MTAPAEYTYATTTPRRPSLDDLGGAGFENHPTHPPDRRTMPNAEEANQKAQNLAGLNRVCPLAVLYVTFAAGAPVLTTVRAMREGVLTSSFTLTDNAAGDTSITWAASLLPGLTFPPTVSVADDVEIDRVRAYVVAGGVRVKTKLGATGTDAAFVVTLL